MDSKSAKQIRVRFFEAKSITAIENEINGWLQAQAGVMIHEIILDSCAMDHQDAPGTRYTTALRTVVVVYSGGPIGRAAEKPEGSAAELLGGVLKGDIRPA